MVTDEFWRYVSDVTYNNAEAVKESLLCGCYFCCQTFSSESIATVDNSKTALCPHCSIDCVIPITSGILLSEDVLHEIRAYALS